MQYSGTVTCVYHTFGYLCQAVWPLEVIFLAQMVLSTWKLAGSRKPTMMQPHHAGSAILVQFAKSCKFVCMGPKATQVQPNPKVHTRELVSTLRSLCMESVLKKKGSDLFCSRGTIQCLQSCHDWYEEGEQCRATAEAPYQEWSVWCINSWLTAEYKVRII